MPNTKEKIGSSSFRTSYLSSVISTSLVLFLLGVAGLLIYNASKLSTFLKDNMTLTVVLHDTSEKEAMSVLSMIEKQDYVRKVKYISKEEAAREMQQELGNDFTTLLKNNPLPIVLELKLNADYFSTDSVDRIQAKLLKDPLIKDVFYQKPLLEAVSNNTEKIGAIILIFVLLLLFVSVFLINNTIRLSIYSKRFLINTMKLVGANSSFIRTPFLASSVWQSLISGVNKAN